VLGGFSLVACNRFVQVGLSGILRPGRQFLLILTCFRWCISYSDYFALPARRTGMLALREPKIFHQDCFSFGFDQRGAVQSPVQSLFIILQSAWPVLFRQQHAIASTNVGSFTNVSAVRRGWRNNPRLYTLSRRAIEIDHHRHSCRETFRASAA